MPTLNPLPTVVVTAEAAVTDAVLARQVVTALHDDPYFPDMHVVVTTNNGVTHLTGFVYDVDDMIEVRRLVKKEGSAA